MYTLVGKVPVPCASPDLWGMWFEEKDRQVDLTEADGVKVSTVFLGIDHRIGEGRPLLFETMVFGLEDEICERYSTWEEAEAGHREVCKKVFPPIGEPT